MIDIPKDEKVRVGKAIEFLRKKEFQNTPSFKIERFIENICSKATYVKLRKVPLNKRFPICRTIEGRQIGCFF